MAEIDAALPREVKVACIQFLPVFGDKDANLSAMARDIRKAAHLGAEIVVLPELADSGYVFNTAPELAGLAEAIPGGRSAESLIALARELGIHIVSASRKATRGDFIIPPSSAGRMDISANIASSICGTARTCSSRQATLAYRSSTPGSAGSASPSVTMAGSRKLSANWL